MAERETGSAENLGMRLTLFHPATVQDLIVLYVYHLLNVIDNFVSLNIYICRSYTLIHNRQLDKAPRYS